MKKELDYVEVLYDEKLKPFTDYPSRLSKYIFYTNNMKPNDKLIELGCGRGEFLKGFSDLGLDCFGLDKSDYAKKCDRTNKHFISLIKDWLKLNPDLIFFIENPRGMLRHMDFMQEFKRHTVWFCQYGDSRAKPTDLWTNSKKWVPKPVCRNYKYDSDGNIIDKHCHHESARRGAKTGTQGKKNSYERSKIPNELCISVLNSII